MQRLVLTTALVSCLLGSPAAAQDGRRVFAGALAGLSALSADARAETDPPAARTSLYDPGLGPALNLFGGIHVAEYVSLQANYMWNRNDLRLVSASTVDGGAAYDQQRTSAQHAVVADLLVYFRRRDSRFRPYLGTGLAVVRFTSREVAASASGLSPPPPDISSTDVGLRSHVGIDTVLTPHLSFRYSFSETIGGNPVSPWLTPPGERGLMNFQNLFGLLVTF